MFRFYISIALYVWLANLLSIPLLFPFLAICGSSLIHEQIAPRVLLSPVSWKHDKQHWSVAHTWFTVNTDHLLPLYFMVQNELFSEYGHCVHWKCHVPVPLVQWVTVGAGYCLH